MLIGFNVIGIRRLWPYLLVGVVLWYFVHASGVHATIAGVALAFTIPTHSRTDAREFSREARSLLDQFDSTETGDFVVLTSKGKQETVFALERASGGVTAPVLRLEHALHNFPAFVVMPLFTFANAGVKIDLSLFIAMLAFEDTALVDAAKGGIIVGSLLAGVAGAVLLKIGLALRDAK